MNEAFNEKIYQRHIGDVHIFYADVSELDINEEYQQLSSYRKKKISQLRRDADKRCSLGVELLLIYALKQLYPDISLPLEITLSDNGKPSIKERPDICFNLAHTGDIAVCAVSDRKIGVDAERITRKNSGVADKYFNERERDMEFAYVWTRKEAAVKADGGGIALGLDTFSVADDIVTLNGETYYLSSFKPEITGYYVSFCVRSDVAHSC